MFPPNEAQLQKVQVAALVQPISNIWSGGKQVNNFPGKSTKSYAEVHIKYGSIDSAVQAVCGMWIGKLQLYVKKAGSKNDQAHLQDNAIAPCSIKMSWIFYVCLHNQYSY